MCMVSGRPDSRRRSKKIPDIAKDHVSVGLRSPGISTLGLKEGTVCKAEEAEQLLRQSKVNS
jgi:hypothetical protein